jgi:hypothetical protein
MARNQDIHLTVLDAQSFNWLRGYYEPDANRRSPIFDRVTHIRLTAINSYRTPMSRLSHFSVPHCLGGHKNAKSLRHFLDLKSLKMLVIAVSKDVIEKWHWKRLQKWVCKTFKRVKRMVEFTS